MVSFMFVYDPPFFVKCGGKGVALNVDPLKCEECCHTILLYF